MDWSEGIGALVGWTSEDLGDRIVLRMDCVTKPPPHGSDDVHRTRFIISKDQAALLGNFLYTISGQTAPRRQKRRMLDRIFG